MKYTRKKTVVKDDVVMALASEYLNKGITAEKLKAELQEIDAYNQNNKTYLCTSSFI